MLGDKGEWRTEQFRPTLLSDIYKEYIVAMAALRAAAALSHTATFCKTSSFHYLI